ncbi:MAG: heparinase II/III family protein [Gemmatimonadetes bacterium]|nr:heparinase II/III family protein [Gemmatimonadota bacterium]
MLLLTREQLAKRRQIAAGALKPLADSLTADLEPLLSAPPFVPDGKALLSRIGGRCETDGTDLEFNPHSPHAHRCPACGRIHTGDWHDRWWFYPYHLWLAERAVHAATLYAVGGDKRHAEYARSVLTGYADRYLSYPNRDNVLGPSRLFFSTYLESLWLLHVCIAGDLLEDAGDRETADTVRDRIAVPAVRLIEEYHEGTSNRQVWNDAAIVAARAFLGEDADSAGIAGALADAESILLQAVGADGSWYEGDNYHQFAHRGMWYVFTLGERLGYDFQRTSVDRFHSGFAAPYRTALPDFTFPARKDSRYAASLRQWRFAESCELGLARTRDPLLTWALERMYAADVPHGDTGRARSSGEAERHSAAVRLSRADLGWQSLLFALPSLSSLSRRSGTAAALTSSLPAAITIDSQGLTIHRRDQGSAYMALDWGESGGGHGHADRLNLLFSHGDVRWLDDLGTGSYVDPSLHWYRSTLAHNAPLINGASQLRLNGELITEARGTGFDSVVARTDGIAPGVRVERTVVTAADYFIDEVRWWSAQPVRFELPMHFAGEAPGLTFASAVFDGAHGMEDGFDFVRDAERAMVAATVPVQLKAERDGRSASAAVWSDIDSEWFRASAPGQPATVTHSFYVVRQSGTHGVIRSVWSWRPSAVSVEWTNSVVAVTSDGATDRHSVGDATWIVSAANGAEFRIGRSMAQNSGQLAGPGDTQPPVPLWGTQVLRVTPPSDEWFSDADDAAQGEWAVLELGEEHYRRSEELWSDIRPTARVAVRAEHDVIVVEVAVDAPEPVFIPSDAVNPFDNEHADINGHGVQLYFMTASDGCGWMLVPELLSSDVRVRRLVGRSDAFLPRSEWRAVPGGFEVRARLPVPGLRGSQVALDVIVNDAVPGRARRRGQLVMSGAAGKFVYLRGDRHAPSQLVLFSVT